nr:S-phase kinase-associated protein 2 [Manis javanica]
MHAFKTPEAVDAMHRKHLQEIPDQSSNVTTSFTWGWDSSKTSELLSGMGVSALEKEEVDSENIPQELLSNLSHPQSPPRKRLKSKGNDKDFVIVRRSKLNRENFPESALKILLSSCSRLDELNLSWCYDFTEKHVQVAVAHVSATITQLNLSGYRRNLQRSDVSTLVGRCPNLVHLDLSDSVMLKDDCFQEFYQLNYLQHLSLSRCYDIIPETLLELGEIPTLKTLQVFGIVPDSTLQLLKEALPHLQINSSHFTTIARPTTGNKKNQEIWGIKCRLALQKPSCL